MYEVSVRGLRCEAQVIYHAPADPSVGAVEEVEFALWYKSRRLRSLELSLSSREWDDIDRQYCEAARLLNEELI